MRAGKAALAAALGLSLGLGGCAEVREAMHPSRVSTASETYGQVPVFDGHELWVAYDCGGSRVDVRYLGAWADAKLSDGSVWRMARTGGGGGRISYSGSGVTLDGPALEPTWTATGVQPVNCKGVVA
ncbi:MAG: hypothetical protein JSR45_18120 [Proteobacteria bacterium]|nr:hypothetical protein [Pseudomonadota bacterium]